LIKILLLGGGFSVSTASPSWQTDAVDGYFNNLRSSMQPYDGYNRRGRAYPDLSMIGVVI
jgi:hypothetical protein